MCRRGVGLCVGLVGLLDQSPLFADASLTAPISLTFTDVDLRDVGHTAAVTGVTTEGVIAGLPDTATLLSFLHIDNVIKNAIESMAAVQRPTHTLTVAAKSEDGYAVIAVTDSGHGIRPLWTSAPTRRMRS